MSFASSMIALIAFGIQVAICSVGLSIYLMLVKENHYKTRQKTSKKWMWTNTNNKRGENISKGLVSSHYCNISLKVTLRGYGV